MEKYRPGADDSRWRIVVALEDDSWLQCVFDRFTLAETMVNMILEMERVDPAVLKGAGFESC